MTLENIWGLDYGNQMAGTTVICFFQEQRLQFVQAEKKKSADTMLLKELEEKHPSLIMMDAPLCLPLIYSHPSIDQPDYFYRACDRQLKAMSPMFLGGLTARAMKFKRAANQLGIEVLETYPAVQLQKQGYKNYQSHSNDAIAQQVAARYSLQLKDEIKNQHQLDALLAYAGGINYINNKHELFGRKEEGLIYI